MVQVQTDTKMQFLHTRYNFALKTAGNMVLKSSEDSIRFFRFISSRTKKRMPTHTPLDS